MNVLIVNNSYHSREYAEFQHLGNVHQIDCKELQNANLESLLSDIRVVFLTGGPQHIPSIQEYPELEYELQLIDIVVQRRIQLIGICLGFQLIHLYFGNPTVPLRVPCIGHNLLDPRTLNAHGDPRLTALNGSLLADSFSFHYDGVITNTHPDIQIVAKSVPLADAPDGILYAIRHRRRPIYAFQNHPDATRESIVRCLKQYDIDGIHLRTADEFETIFHDFFLRLFH